MNLRMIDGQPFFVMREGKRETILTPAEAVTEQEQRVAALLTALGAAEAEAAQVEGDVEASLLADGDTAKLRAQLVVLRESAQSLHPEIEEAQAAIAEVRATMDRIEAQRVREADAARLAALTAPYDNILKECMQ